MPSYRVHVVGGAVFGASCIYFLNAHTVTSPQTLATWMFCAMLGALFPDIDIKSKGQGIFYLFLIACLAAALMTRQKMLFIALAFLSFLPILSRHRGIFHNPWVITAVGGTFLLMAPRAFQNKAMLWNVAFFILGAFSHVILDIGFRGFWRRLTGKW